MSKTEACSKSALCCIRQTSNEVKKETLSREEIRRFKEDLMDLEKYIEELSNFLPLAVCVVNPLGIIININRAFEELTKFKAIEMVGERLQAIFLEKDKVKKIEKEVLKKEIIKARELTLIAKEKKEIPVSISVSERKDEEGNFIGYFVALFDITEIKKSREKLEEKVKERTKELQGKIDELERFRRLTVGRELTMIELKKEVEKLEQELKEAKKDRQ